MKKLTEKQQRVYDYIASYIDERHIAPTYREIASYMGSSINSALQHVRLLERKGRIVREKNLYRSMNVVPQTEEAQEA